MLSGSYDVSISDTMIPAAQLVAMVAGRVTGEPSWGRFGLAGVRVVRAGSSETDEAPLPQEDAHARRHPQIQRRPGVVDEARGKLGHLEQTTRGTPGFVAYYFLETDDGVATITITEDESGTTESMNRAATWVQQNLESRDQLGRPEVTTGQVLISATR
jgi:hypothetical protein